MPIAPGTPVPRFTLQRADGGAFTREDLLGATSVLAFYPAAFSPVCTDQLQVYDEAREALADLGATLYGVSTDDRDSQRAFRDALGIGFELLGDADPPGATALSLGVFDAQAGVAQRALVIVGADGVVRWSHAAATSSVVPGVNLIFDALRAS